MCIRDRFSRAKELQELAAADTRPQPFQRADDCIEEWGKIWSMHECAATPMPQGADKWDSLPSITVTDIRRAAASFLSRTASGHSAFNPKALLQVSDVGLEVLAPLFAACERMNSWPEDR
eukprot:2567178-Pyramimonas_sp.AAC.1